MLKRITFALLVTITSDDHLILSGGLVGREHHLYPVGEGHYADELNGVATTNISKFNKKWYIQTPDASYQQITPLAYYSRVIGVSFVFATLLLVLIYAIYWLPMVVIGSIKGRQNIVVRMIPLLGISVFLSDIILDLVSVDFGFFNNHRNHIFICVTVLSLATAIRCLGWNISKVGKVQLFLSTTSYLFISGFMFYWGLV